MGQTKSQTEQMMRYYDGKLLPDQVRQVMTEDHGWFPTRKLLKSAQPRVFPRRASHFPDIRINFDGRRFDLFDYITTNQVLGLTVLKAGALALEVYQRGITRETLLNSNSVAKSFASTLVGIALAEGCISSLEDPLSRYLGLGTSPYSNVTVRQLLQMTSGVKWDETYRNPGSNRRQLLEIQRGWVKGGILDYMKTLEVEVSPGMRSHYSTGESYLVSALLEAATGENMVDYMSDRLWSRIGAEFDGRWWVESENGGMGISGSGMNASLGDYARFGQFFLEQFQSDTRSILPPGWCQEASTAVQIDGKTFPYGYMWWLPELQEEILEGSFSADGIYGQYIHINPKEDLVIVVSSARAKPSERDRLEINDEAFFAAVAHALH